MKKNSKAIFKKNKIKSDLWAWLLILPSLYLLYFIVWRPVASGAYMSLFELRGFKPVEFVGLDNYRRILSDTTFLKTLGNTLQYVFWSLCIGMWPPIVLAIIINEIRHHKNFIRFGLYFPNIVPAIATSMMWYMMFYPNNAGMLNMIRGLLGLEPGQWLQDPKLTIPLIVFSMTWNGFGATTIMYLASLQGINRELYEAALIDGAGIITRIRKITLPHMKGMILLFLVRQIIGVFQIMEQPLAMTGGGPNNASVSLALQGYRYAFVYKNSVHFALANNVIMFLILIVMTAFYFYLERKVETE